MRILIHDFGGFPFILQLASVLAKAGHEVTCVYANLLETPRSVTEAEGSNPRYLGLPVSPHYRRDKANLLSRFKHEIAYGRTAAKTITRFNPEVVLSANTPTHAQLFIMRACRRGNIRFIYWIQDFYSMAVSDQIRRRLPFVGALFHRAYTALEKHLYAQSDMLVPISDAFRPVLRKWKIPDSRVMVIHNWAPIDRIPLRVQHNKWASHHGLAGKFCFLYSGTLGSKHNPALIHQLARQFENDPNVRVVAVAEGPGTNELQALALARPTANLVMLPLQPEHTYPDVLATGNVLLAVLEEDAGRYSVPSKVLSYLCAGRPVLLSAPPGNLASRIIREARAGLCSPADNPGRFLQHARWLRHASSDSLSLRGGNARCYAETHFTAARIREQFEQVLSCIQ